MSEKQNENRIVTVTLGDMVGVYAEFRNIAARAGGARPIEEEILKVLGERILQTLKDSRCGSSRSADGANANE